MTLVVMTFSMNSTLAGANNSAGFERLKTLVGEWQGKTSEGHSANISYQLISNGSALMETVTTPGEPNMVTIYHPDGDKLMMTHYCSAGSQPRMRAAVPTGEIKSLNFVFIDGANLEKHNGAHMHSLTVTFVDKDHITQEWIWRDAGKDVQAKFVLERKR